MLHIFWSSSCYGCAYRCDPGILDVILRIYQEVIMFTHHTMGPEPQPRLTRQQLRTLRMAFDGRPSREIAADLGVPKRTVEWHLYLAYQTLGVHNRVQAYHKARSLGLLGR